MGDNLDDALETFVASDELEKEIEQEVRSAEPALEQGSEENEVAAEQTPSATDADDAFIAEHLNSLQSADDATTSSEGSTPHDASNGSEGAFLEGAPAGDFAELAPKKTHRAHHTPHPINPHNSCYRWPLRGRVLC